MGKLAQRGFTLVEALTAMSITAAAVTTAAGNWTPILLGHRAKSVAAELSTDLQFARTEAVSRRQGVRVTFAPAAAMNSCYVVHTGPTSSCDCSRPEPATCNGAAILIKRVQVHSGIRAFIPSNARSIQFDGTLGTVTPTASITVATADGRSLRHVVNVIGRVRTCSPEGTFSGYRRC